MSDTSEQTINPSGATDLEVGDWVIQKSKPELGVAIVTDITYYRSGSQLWEVVSTDEPTWRGTLSQCLEKVGPRQTSGGQ